MIPMIVTVLVTVVFVVAFLSFRRSGGRGRFPPGNTYLPLIGESASFFEPHPPYKLPKFMADRISRYGKIFSTHLMGRRMVISADAELNRFVLKNEGRRFATTPTPGFKKLIGLNTYSPDATAHKLLRTISMDFFAGKRLQSVFLEDADTYASHLLSSWDCGSVVFIKDEAVKYSWHFSLKRILGMSPEDSKVKMMMIEYDKFVSGLFSLPLSIPGTNIWRTVRARRKLTEFFTHHLEDKAKQSEEDEDDLVANLLRNSSFSQETVANILVGVILATHDTISRAISLMVYFLGGCPKAIKQLQEEHRRIARERQQAGGGESYKLTWDNYKSMNFTQCVIHETLRLGNVAAFILRTAVEDVEFKGYVIPKGCGVLLHFHSVHLDPSLFEEPELFNPWRWQSSTGMKVTNNFMAFAGGGYYCAGAELAKLKMAVFLHHLTVKYEWELAEPDHPMKLPFVTFPKGLPIKIRAASQMS